MESPDGWLEMDPERKKEVDRVAEKLKQLKKDQEDISVKISDTSSRLNALKENAYTPSERLLAEARAKAKFYEDCFGYMKEALKEERYGDNWIGWDGQPKEFREARIREQLEQLAMME